MTSNPFREAVCFDIKRENWNVKTFCFRLVDSDGKFDFEAGQYVTIGCMVDGEPVFRCYTISCAPATQGAGEFEITVKHSPGGVVSTWLHGKMEVGAKVQVSHATGDFVLPLDPEESLLFVAGGVGITPLMSMARHAVTAGAPRNIQFLQFSRTADDILFRSELDEFDVSSAGFAAQCFTSRPENAEIQGERLCVAVLDRAVPDWRSRRILCCGPDSFMAEMRSIFLANDGDSARFHQESFDIPEAPPVHLVVPTNDYTVQLSESGLEAMCAAGSTVLDAVHALPQGVKIPNACRSGVCGTCKVRKVTGDVDMQHNGGITEEEEEEGFILACCSIPLTNIVIEY